jgi:hypothetical protein
MTNKNTGLENSLFQALCYRLNSLQNSNHKLKVMKRIFRYNLMRAFIDASLFLNSCRKDPGMDEHEQAELSFLLKHNSAGNSVLAKSNL